MGTLDPLMGTLDPLMGTLKPQSNSNTVIGTLTVHGWAVTFGIARSGLTGARKYYPMQL